MLSPYYFFQILWILLIEKQPWLVCRPKCADHFFLCENKQILALKYSNFLLLVTFKFHKNTIIKLFQQIGMRVVFFLNFPRQGYGIIMVRASRVYSKEIGRHYCLDDTSFLIQMMTKITEKNTQKKMERKKVF